MNPNQNQVYKTMVEPKPETIQYLTGWIRPKYAYVLFETKERKLYSQGVAEMGTGLMTLNVEGRADQAHQIDIYLGKGFRILDYGNFPKLNDPSKARANKAQHYSHGAGMNPWDALENYIKGKISPDLHWAQERAAMAAENDALRAKLLEAQAKKEAKESKEAKQ